MPYFKQTPVDAYPDNKITSDSNIIMYSQYLLETQQAAVQYTNSSAQQDSMILFVIEQMSKQMINYVTNWDKANKKANSESLIAELERYKERVKTFKQRLNIDLISRETLINSQMDDMIRDRLALKKQIDSLKQNLSNQIKKSQRIKPTLYDGSLISRQHDVILVTDEEDTLILEDVKQAFWLPLSNPNSEQPNDTQTSVRVEVPKELQKCSIGKKLFEIEKKELKLENERLLEHIICQDVVNIVMHADDKSNYLLISQDLVHIVVNSIAAINDFKSMEQSYLDEYKDNLKLTAKLAKKNDMIEKSVYNELSKKCSQLEKCCISLELKLQNDHENYIKINKAIVVTLRDIVEQARTANPLDNALAYACMYTEQIQGLLVYVSDTCPSSPLKSEKLVAVTPMNKARKVTFAKISATSENSIQTQVDLHKTQTTNKPLVPSTSVKSSTNASGSIPRCNIKNTRILKTSSSN
ncbi:hypothetical protein Tco_1112239 [Tanacetum coccineum]|uniref:Uncharacterized protein n=1 Tax=Tanacetum coccineum TaxID=301880 RepID=A0ABQ5INV8_9ASTR